MSNALRDRRTPSELAEGRQVIEIAEKIGEFRRLAEAVERDLGGLAVRATSKDWRNATVEGTLSFAFADAHRRLPMLEGTVRVITDVVCQRCLEPFKLPLLAELRLLFPGKGDTSVTAEGLETWELEDTTLQPLDVVDEALVMALPLAPMHADAALCEVSALPTPFDSTSSRPFAGLRAAMDRKD